MNKISDDLKKDWPILILILFGFALGAYFYPSLPDRVPIHWNIKGEIDGYGSKAFGAFAMPGINLAVYIMMLFLPHIDPRKKNYAGFRQTYQFTKYLLVLFLLGIEVLMLLTAMGVNLNVSFIIMLMVSLLFIFLGNVMGRFKHNYFVGIKTPWTLANEEVWRKTHRLAGPLWVLGGILNIVLSLLGGNIQVIGFIVIIVVMVVVPLVYSFLAYRQLTPDELS